MLQILQNQIVCLPDGNWKKCSNVHSQRICEWKRKLAPTLMMLHCCYGPFVIETRHSVLLAFILGFELIWKSFHFFLNTRIFIILWFNSNDNYVFQCFNNFWPFFRQLCGYLPKNWGSDSHFELLNGSKSGILKKWQIFSFWVFKTHFG